MEINNSYNTLTPKYNFSNNKVRYGRTSSMPNDSVSFTAHAQMEKVFSWGFKRLVQQTAFDREPETKQFVCDYLLKNFGDIEDKIKFVVGGCSTGEEAVSYCMRLYNMGEKVDVLGVDLGRNAIKQAKSRRYVFEIPNKEYDFKEELGIPSPYTDVYLVTPGVKGLTPQQRMFKALFNEFFEPTGENIRRPFGEWMQIADAERMGYTPLKLERKAYRLKDGMAENCTFVRDDIKNIDKVMNGEKAHAISFSNALYHLTSFFESGYERIPRKNAAKIVEDLMTKFKECLNPKGIVVFGEKEEAQIGDAELVPAVMKKLGFTPLNKTSTHEANVWRVG